MNSNRKGGQFERQICKALSLWWTDGGRDDIYWRSSQSGGRATQRAKTHQRTAGSYGDVAVIDPIGIPLLKVFTIELKKGKSHGSLGELVGLLPMSGFQKFEATLKQVRKSQRFAQSLSWLIISQQVRREIMVYGDWSLFRQLGIRPTAVVRWRGGLTLAATTFSRFKQMKPEKIRQLWKNRKSS